MSDARKLTELERYWRSMTINSIFGKLGSRPYPQMFGRGLRPVPSVGEIMQIDQAMVRRYRDVVSPNRYPYVAQEPSGVFVVRSSDSLSIYSNRDRLCAEAFVSAYGEGFAGRGMLNPFLSQHICALAYSDGWSAGRKKLDEIKAAEKRAEDAIEAERKRKAEKRNVVSFNIGETPAYVPVSGMPVVTVNGQAIHNVKGIEMSAGVDEFTEITLSFTASISPATQEQLKAAFEEVSAKGSKDLMASFIKDMDKGSI